MKYIILSILFFTFSLFVFADNDNNPVGARHAGMANSSVMLSDIWSIYHNQAGLARINSLTFGGHFENRFFVEELSLQSAAFAIPSKSGTFGVSLTYFGYNQYNQSKIGLAYAKSLGEKIDVGIQLDYFNTNIGGEYGNRGTAVGEIGIRAEPIDNLIIGAHLFNPTRSKIADYDDERIPTIMRLGLGYNFSDKLLITTETEKTLEQDIIFKFGAELNMLEHLYLRTGVATGNPTFYTFGIGYKMDRLQADMAFSSHQILGYTVHISMSFAFGNKKSE